ncbi:MAG: type II toxin-antitoxin system Phd/YefM family antitoxin [Opitutus sp.]|nr:type II toxin-antitoxin system Phd/YefM family antitoxin [Opitutus sp.]MCS6247504.1 type II toxin-antitoxin system Phd/YefM family antitoxin [Opitutus sp.]MCS6273884.1 type II toxin-antitoxin system Phd/YefM family antitoxin [Opitutus sp.]MCS6278230.1 type II toxin-antitoxin system Phd/YefM family antitoxin [Opitutus sp.]MCS6299340.1 type II toxin-antitoxin system Phd/YefM family antitoxin [Opitutus sp.]
MANVVNVHEAKTQLSRLLSRVEAGEEIIIARAGHPFARLVPLAAHAPDEPRQPGRFKGMFGALPPAEALAPLPAECTGLMTSPTDPLNLA